MEHINTRCAQNLEFANVAAGSIPTYCYHCALKVKNLYWRLLHFCSMFCLPVDAVAYVSVSPHSSVVCIPTAQLYLGQSTQQPFITTTTLCLGQSTQQPFITTAQLCFGQSTQQPFITTTTLCLGQSTQQPFIATAQLCFGQSTQQRCMHNYSTSLFLWRRFWALSYHHQTNTFSLSHKSVTLPHI